MRRTLLAVGIAVVVSMLLTPHGYKDNVYVFGPFFSDYGFDAAQGFFWYHKLELGPYRGKVMIERLALQTVFLAVLSAVIVNVRKPRQKKE